MFQKVAPGRGRDVAKLAFSALISGAISTLTSASVAGLVITDQKNFFTSSAAG